MSKPNIFKQLVDEARKTCYCFTCKKNFHPGGIARHRGMHRDKKELCEIRYTHGDVYEHDYRDTPQPLFGGNKNGN